MDEEFENFNDQDEEWLTELEIRATDLENELFDWREAHARELAETSYGRDGAPRRTRDARTGALRAQSEQAPSQQAPPQQAPPRQTSPKHAPPRGPQPGEALHHVIEDEDPEQDDDLTTIIRTGARPGWPHPGRGGPPTGERTQALIDRGRRSAGRARMSRTRKIVLGAAGLAVVAHRVGVPIQVKTRPGRRAWPPSRAR